MASLCTKLAGLGALSALCVLKRRSRRCGRGSLVVESVDEAKARWARDGGLYEESRMNSVLGRCPDSGSQLCIAWSAALGGFTVRMTRKAAEDDTNDLRALSRVDKIERVLAMRDAISSIAIEICEGMVEDDVEDEMGRR
jgi:hypothetical protein